MQENKFPKRFDRIRETLELLILVVLSRKKKTRFWLHPLLYKVWGEWQLWQWQLFLGVGGAVCPIQFAFFLRKTQIMSLSVCVGDVFVEVDEHELNPKNKRVAF